MNLQHIADIAWQYLGTQQLNEHQAAYGILAENGFNNPAAYALVDTWNELYNFWRVTRSHEFMNNDGALQENVNTTVMMCFLAHQVAKYANLQQTLSQQAADTYNQWLELSRQLEVEMDSFYRPSQVRNYPPQPGQYQYQQAPQQNYVDPRFQRSMSPSQFANRQQPGYQQPVYAQQPNTYQQAYQQPYQQQPVQQAPAYQRPVTQPTQQQPYATNNGRSHHRYGSTQQPAPQQTHQPQPTGQATVSRKYESKTAQPAPQNPQYQRPLTPQQQQNAQQAHDSWQLEVSSAPTATMKGRDLAEARYGDVTAGSWDDSPISGDHSFDAMAPLFEERISSSNGGARLTYVDAKGKPFTIDDWRKKPDPDFPYELGYAPRTHRRVIAWDHKKECYIQIVEEHGQVDYDAHKQLEGSAVVRKRTPAERERNPFDPAGSKVTTLGDAIERRQEIIDRRVAAAKDAWAKQEAEAAAAAENGNAYVAPELIPAAEIVESTPLPEETQEEIDVGSGRLTEGVLDAGILKNAYISIEHALYGLRAGNVLADLDDNQVASTEFVFHEVTPFILDCGDYDFVRNQLTELTPDSKITSLLDIAAHLKKIAKLVPQELWTKYNDQATRYINSILANELNLEGVDIDNFAEDLADLPGYLKSKYPEALTALTNNGGKLYRNLMCILPATTMESYEKISRNLYGDQTEQLNDRSVFLSRKIAVAKVKASTEQLGLYSESRSCAVTEESHPELWWMLSCILKRNATRIDRDEFDGAAQYLVTSDNAVFTIHENWLNKDDATIIIRRQRVL